MNKNLSSHPNTNKGQQQFADDKFMLFSAGILYPVPVLPCQTSCCCG